MKRTLFACITLPLALAGSGAHAICPIFPTHVRVGADANNCSYNTIQAAIDAAGSCPVVIDVTREHLYGSGGFCTPSQSGGCHLTISSKANVTLQGWGDGITCEALNSNVCEACGPGQTTPLVTLDGGNGGGPVLSIGGNSNVSLYNLTLTHGATAYDGSGGGIAFAGTGSLILGASTVSNNYAGYGGGISMNGAGGSAALTLQANAQVLANTAQFSGGGIRLEGGASLLAEAPQTLIAFNHALGYNPVLNVPLDGFGGGVEILGPARADIGSPGYGNAGVIYFNDAVDGGGIAVFASQNGDFTEQGLANFYTTDANTPVGVDENFASSLGGAIYAKGYITYLGVYSYATVCMANYRISGNAAPDGAIAYLDWDTDISQTDLGSRLFLNTAGCASKGVTCAPGAPCNRAYDNLSQDAGGQPTSGSAIVVGTSSTFRADKLDLRGSNGSYLVRIVGDNDGGFAEAGLLRSCVFAGNSVSQSLIDIQGGNATMAVDNCTVADNTIGGDYTFGVDALTNAIVFQPGKKSYAGTATYVLANDISQLPAGTTVQTLGDPRFVDAAAGDYHLRLDSPAVDYAGGLGGTDLEGYPRDVDLATKANAFGPRDLGAYERQSAYACDDAPERVVLQRVRDTIGPPKVHATNKPAG